MVSLLQSFTENTSSGGGEPIDSSSYQTDSAKCKELTERRIPVRDVTRIFMARIAA
jgi:hypothetical protein